MNAERSGHWRTRAGSTAVWRTAFFWLAQEQHVPHLDACTIVVEHLVSTRRRIDPAACLPGAKAAIDGLVDAGVLDDDSGQYVHAVTFTAPRHVAGFDALRLTIHPINHPEATP